MALHALRAPTWPRWRADVFGRGSAWPGIDTSAYAAYGAAAAASPANCSRHARSACALNLDVRGGAGRAHRARGISPIPEGRLLSEMAMPRFHYTDIAERFTHIDATFTGFEFEQGGNARLRVRFYPWWEHPAYLRAIEVGETWGFADCSSGEAELTVFARSLQAVSLTRSNEITEWSFHREHPLLLPYERSVQVFCNGALEQSQALRVMEVVEECIGGWFLPWRFLNATSLSSFLRLVHNDSFALGDLPHSMATRVQAVLQDLGVPTFAPHSARYASDSEGQMDLALLLLDGGDYLIADDFELEVPEFVHRPEYFKT